MSKHLRSIGLWLLILALVLGACSWLFYPKDNSEKAGMENELITGYLTEPDNTLDVLVLGDSLPLTDFNPWVLWQEKGYSSYVCASQGQNVLRSLELLRQFCAHQTPKVVLVETNHLYGSFTRLDAMTDWVFEKVPLLEYHDNWKTVPLTEMVRPLHYTYKPAGRGHFCRKLTLGMQEAHREPWGDQVLEIPQCGQETLEKMNAICTRMGARLILVSMPSAVSWEEGRREPLEALAAKLGVPYVEMNGLDLAIDWETDTMDGGDHLNYLGAEKASRYLASYLEDLSILQDHRQDPAYAHWHTECGNFLELAEKADNSVR